MYSCTLMYAGRISQGIDSRLELASFNTHLRERHVEFLTKIYQTRSFITVHTHHLLQIGSFTYIAVRVPYI